MRAPQCGRVNRVPLFAGWQFVFANTPWLTAFQDAPAGPQNAKKADAATDLAAGQAFLAVVRSHSYSVPEDKVREVVLAFLRKDTTQVPKSMPTVDQLQGDLDLDFEAAWTEMIKVAAAGLDPTGELGVANRLRKHLVDNPQLRSDTKKEYDDLLKNDLPKTLERVKGTLVDQQQEQLIEALKNVVSSDMPGQQRVCDSMTDREPATKALTTEVVQRIPEELRATVLIESFAALSDEADKVVSDGVDST